jgi:hypothetical protein
MRTIPWKSTFAAMALMAWSGLAQAQLIGNPVSSLDAGRLGFGVALDQYNRDLEFENGGTDDLDYRHMTFQLDYAPAAGSMVQGFLGLVRAKPDQGSSFDGQEIGVSYRQNVDIKIPVGDQAIQTALVGAVRYGDLNDGDSFDYLQLDVGYGGSYPAAKQLAIYAGVLFSEIWGEVGSTSVNSADNLGLFGGVDFSVMQNVHLSAELHLLHEFGVGVQFQYNM